MGRFVDRSRKLRLRVATLIAARKFTSPRRAALSVSAGEGDYGPAIERVVCQVFEAGSASEIRSTPLGQGRRSVQAKISRKKAP